MSRPRASEFSTARLEAARVLARYRKLILLGRLRLPHDAARSLVGPDCAYHLYGRSVPSGVLVPTARSAPPRAAARKRRGT